MEKSKSRFASISADLNQALQKWNQLTEHPEVYDIEDSPAEKNLNELQLLLKELQEKIQELAN